MIAIRRMPCSIAPGIAVSLVAIVATIALAPFPFPPEDTAWAPSFDPARLVGGSSAPQGTTVTLPDGSSFTYHSWGVDALNVPGAWAQGVLGEGVRVAVIEPGKFDAAHPFYASRVAWCVDLTGAAGGCHSDNWAAADHGTHVAGIVHQVAPNATLYLISITGSSDPPARQVQRALELAASGPSNGPGADVATISDAIVLNLPVENPPGWGIALSRTSPLNPPAGLAVVAAAGNYGGTPAGVAYPAADPAAISVGALKLAGDAPDSRLLYGDGTAVDLSSSDGIDEGNASLRSAGELDVAAPGIGIVSSLPQGHPFGEYGAASGTSMAAPHVAGLLALLKQTVPNATAEDLRARLWCASHDLALNGKFTAPGYDVSSGHGLPDAVRLLSGACLSTLGPADVPALLIDRIPDSSSSIPRSGKGRPHEFGRLSIGG